MQTKQWCLDPALIHVIVIDSIMKNPISIIFKGNLSEQLIT